MRKLELPEREICNLYRNKKVSTNLLANIYGCSKRTIVLRLRNSGVQLREPGSPRLTITKKTLEELYLKKKFSIKEVAKLLHCGRTSIYNRLVRFKIPIRDLSDSHIKYRRMSFSMNPFEKAYLLGFRMGDLRIRKIGKNSKTIKVDCRSTKQEQIKLFYRLFSKYGHIWLSRKDDRGGRQMEAFLDDSFSFLLKPEKELENLFNNEEYFLHFLAGFIDADGSFYITDKKANFSLGNYNHKLLKLIRKKLLNYGIEIPKLTIDKKLRINSYGYKRRNFYYSLTVHKKNSLLKLFDLIGNYLKHEKRISDMNKDIDNIKEREN